MLEARQRASQSHATCASDTRVCKSSVLEDSVKNVHMSGIKTRLLMRHDRHKNDGSTTSSRKSGLPQHNLFLPDHFCENPHLAFAARQRHFASPRVATVLCSSTNTLQVILRKNLTARRSHFCVSHRTQHAPRQVSTTTHHARLSTERSTAAKTVFRSSHPLRMPILHLVFFSHAVETPGMLVQGRPGVRWPAQAGVKMGNARRMQVLSSCSGGRE